MSDRTCATCAAYAASWCHRHPVRVEVAFDWWCTEWLNPDGPYAEERRGELRGFLRAVALLEGLPAVATRAYQTLSDHTPVRTVEQLGASSVPADRTSREHPATWMGCGRDAERVILRAVTLAGGTVA